jgi:hypothetical protein
MAAGARIGAIEGEIGHAALGASRWEAICGPVGGRRDRSIGRRPGLSVGERPSVIGEGRG